MNNIFTFLLPHTTLDWFFFSLLLGWLAISLIAAKKAKSNIDERIHSSHFKNIRASVTELSTALRHPMWDHIVENAPGFALVLGLLGTFLGIGLAIAGAGQILADMNSGSTSATDMRQAIGNLSPMLAEIGLKFKSSAWGILVHIALRLIIPAFGIDEKRSQEILKQLEKDAEQEEEAVNTRWKQIEDLLQRALFTNTAQAGSIAKVMETQSGHLAIIAEVQQTFGDNVKTLGTSVKEFEKTVDAFRGSMKVAIQEMQESVQSASQGLHDTVESMKKEVSTTFTEFRDNVSQTLAKVGDDISTSSLAIKSSVDTLSESMSRELQNVTMVTASLTTHSREMAVAINEQKLTLEEMGNKVQSIAAKGAEYAFSLEDVTSNIGKLAGSDGIIASSLEKVAKNTHESNQHLEVLANNVTIAEKNTLSNSVAEI
ncbi:hypothetical protein [Acinetobacter sp. ANC 5414]|uniref:hypothetical protein n=1 Tax=Acinetobacter sp. ANC 5414 TaxID=2731251 RepID=UPI00148FAE70|nr:hypothetical protein [Acinetobacter sp. ANC 5414]NNG99847.1 hypothetical protein [Acinetobacter sp. ANC 5414]